MQKNMEFISREGTQMRDDKTLMREAMLANPEFRAWAHAEQRLIAELRATRLRIRNIMDEKRESAGKGIPVADRHRIGFELKKNRQEYFRLSLALGELREKMKTAFSKTVVRKTCEIIDENSIVGDYPEIEHKSHLSECAYRHSLGKAERNISKFVDMRVF